MPCHMAFLASNRVFLYQFDLDQSYEGLILHREFLIQNNPVQLEIGSYSYGTPCSDLVESQA